jgi:hypothetical protein
VFSSSRTTLTLCDLCEHHSCVPLVVETDGTVVLLPPNLPF